MCVLFSYSENVCDFIEIPDDPPKTPRYVHGDIFSFMRRGKAQIEIKLLDSKKIFVYSVKLGDTARMTGGGKELVGPTAIPGIDRAPHWIPFWVDLRKTGRVVVGTGSTVLINYTPEEEKALPFIFFPDLGVREQIVYCDKKGS